MTAPAASFADVAFTYPERDGFALAVPSLEIAPGERVACVGHSGCGKTTLINLLSGVLVPQRGEVRVGDVVMSRLSEPERRAQRIRRIGMVFQEFELLDYLSALDNILLPYRLSPATGDMVAARRRSRALASTLGVGHLLNRKPTRLSQGERQRVAVCRALVTQPDLVIADEPTGNLDPKNASGVIELLLEHVTTSGAAMLVVTHNHELLKLFDRVIHLDTLNQQSVAEPSP